MVDEVAFSQSLTEFSKAAQQHNDTTNLYEYDLALLKICPLQ